MSDDAFTAAARELMQQAIAQGRDPVDPPAVEPGADALPPLDQALKNLVTAKLVRQYVRGAIVEPAVKRLYNIGMGVQQFAVPTMTGRVVNVPASASVQVRALTKLIEVGVPPQVGLVDDAGDALPGVFALGPLDLDLARQVAHGERYIPLQPGDLKPEDAPTDAALTPGIAQREGIEIVEVEADEQVTVTAEDAPPAPPPTEPTLEQQILARRRARRAKSNGRNGNGVKP